jgi:POT family proton-dependent oligopeptide transporter
METNGTPNDMVQTMNQIGCILFVPFTQHVMNPFLHRRNIYIQPITRIAIGFLFICVAMLYASLVQHAIYSTGPCYAHPNVCGGGTLGPNKLNVWIQAPTYLLIAAGEVFAVVTAIEYAYTNAPEDMKAIVQSINLIIAGMGSALGMALTPLAHDPNMTAFYGSLSGAMLVTAIVFWTLFRKSEDTSLPRIALKKASFSSSDKSNSTTSHVRHSNEGQTNDPELGIITDITQVMPPLTDPESGDSNHLESKETAAPEGLYSGL